jgi:Zn-dependent membrane protease YugP
MFFLLGPNYIMLMLAALVIGGVAQFFVNSAYRKWSQVPLATGKTGAEVARAMLNEAGLFDVEVRPTPGRLTDNYDPRSRVLNLSQGVYDGRSVASAGIASHEAGHAVQHARAFAPATVRQALVPAANLGSQGAWIMIMLGIFTRFTGLITIGAALFGLAVLFQFVTLPVEFDASRRAMASLKANLFLPHEQVAGARRVLTAAAMTYVAATLVSVMYLLYYLGLGRRR